MKTLLTLVLLFASLISYSQEISDPKELYEEAQYFFQREDYKEALYFYKRLIQKTPDNANFNFKVGECYLNIAGQEYLAVSYLKKAVLSIEAKNEYKSYDYNEENAPLHSYFFLGNAFRAAGELDSALTWYAKYIDSPYFHYNYNLGVVEAEVKSCERAKIIQDTPVKIAKSAIDPDINTDYSEFNPLRSKDGNSLIFMRGLKFYDAIFYSVKKEGVWSKPININPDVVSDGDYYPTGVNSDGTKMLLTREADLNADIYISYLKGGSWTKAERLRGKINSAVFETYATFGASDDIIYLVSDRQGGPGGKDIFYSTLGAKDKWSRPKSIGKVINSKEDEDTPVICDDGKTLFFSSESHYNMGRYDVFYSFYEDNTWSIPRNIGSPVNTTRDDVFYIVDETCLSALFSIIDPETGYSDIYSIKLEEPLAKPGNESQIQVQE